MVREIVGREAEDFRTIAERYISADPGTAQTFGNKLGAFFSVLKILLTPPWDIEKYERELKIPNFKNMMIAGKSSEWQREHAAQ